MDYMNFKLSALLTLSLLSCVSPGQVVFLSNETSALQSGIDGFGEFFTRSDSTTSSSINSSWSYVDTTGGFGGIAESVVNPNLFSSGPANEVAHVLIDTRLEIGTVTTADVSAMIEFQITEQMVMEIDFYENGPNFLEYEIVGAEATTQKSGYCFTTDRHTLMPGRYTFEFDFVNSTTRPDSEGDAGVKISFSIPIGSERLDDDRFCLLTPEYVIDGFYSGNITGLASVDDLIFVGNRFQGYQIDDEFLPWVGQVQVLTRVAGRWVDSDEEIQHVPIAYEQFGSGISTDGQTLAIGAQGYEFEDVDGSVYLYQHMLGFWEHIQSLSAPKGYDPRRYGSEVAIGGEWLVVLSYQKDAHLYRRNSGVWEYVQTMPLPPSTSFIRSISMNNGILGMALSNSSSADPAVVVYEEIRGVWVLVDELEAGRPYSTVNEVIVEGGWIAVSNLSTNPEQSSNGIWMYQLTDTGWELNTHIRYPVRRCKNQTFIGSKSLRDDKFFVGSSNIPVDGTDTGYLYEFDGNRWVPLSKHVGIGSNGALSDDELVLLSGQFNDAVVVTKLSPQISWDYLGVTSGYDGTSDLDFAKIASSLSISELDNVVYAGSPGLTTNGPNTGGLWRLEYDLDNDDWGSTGLIAPAGLQEGDLYGHANDSRAYQDSATYTHLAVGAHGTDGVGSNSGAVYIHLVRKFEGVLTTQQIEPDTLAANSLFGSEVRFSPDGSELAVAAVSHDAVVQNGGAVYIFSGDVFEDWLQNTILIPSDSQVQDFFGSSIAFGDDMLAIGAFKDDDAGSDAGSAYIYRRTNGDWGLEQKLTPSASSGSDLFGSSLAWVDDQLAVGAPGASTDGVDSGAVYVFAYDGNNWTQTQRLSDIEGSSGDQFGFSLAGSGDALLIGAPLSDRFGTDSGDAIVFFNDSQEWIQESRMYFPDEEFNPIPDGGQIGSAIAFDGTHAMIGAPFSEYSMSDPDRGLIYPYLRPDCHSEPCPADYTFDGSLDFFDISAFLTLYTDNLPQADFNEDGSLDFFDISAFLAAFQSGCP